MTQVTPFTEIFGGMFQSFGNIYIVFGVLSLLFFGLLLVLNYRPLFALILAGTPSLLLASEQVLNEGIYAVRIVPGFTILLLGLLFAITIRELFFR